MSVYRSTLFIFFFLCASASSSAEQTWSQVIHDDVKDTLATGVPVALVAAAVWAVANRIPHEWDNLTGPVAEFIYTTWEEQGFKKARRVLIKQIPKDSFLARIVVYTQELPGALAVGQQFIDRIEMLLHQREYVQEKLLHNPDNKALQRELEGIEDGLDECRFVCGHERVHKERHHTYHMLLTQFWSPFFVYSFLKHTRLGLYKKKIFPRLQWLLKRSLVRSSLEVAIGWIRTRQIEAEADRHASDDPKIIKAGLRLFKRALHGKRSRSKKRWDWKERIIGWVINCTHPTLQERVFYLEKYLKKMEKPTEHHAARVADECFQS